MMHLILNKSLKNEVTKRNRNKIINLLHKKNTKRKYLGIYASYHKSNIKAKKYYLKNDYKIYHNNIFFNFVKKKIS